MIRRRWSRAILCVGMAFGLIFVALDKVAPLEKARADEATTSNEAPVVVELFTSQACSSCPPADRLLGQLAQREGLIALSMPVHYWNHLGWKDTLSRAEHSERQRQYARKLGLPNVYTPQIVVGGREQTIGSRARQVQAAIRKVRGQQAHGSIPVEIKLRDNTFVVRIGAGNLGDQHDAATILVVPVLSKRTVNIKHGENRGKSITYHNVSRKLMRVGKWHGEAKTLTLDHDEVMVGDTDRCAIILQDDATGVILGAAMLSST